MCARLWGWVKRHPYLTTAVVVTSLVVLWRRRTSTIKAHHNDPGSVPQEKPKPISEVVTVPTKAVSLIIPVEAEDVPEFQVNAVVKSGQCVVKADDLKTEKERWTIFLFYSQNYACGKQVLEFDSAWEDFSRANCNVIGCSNDTSLSHESWNARNKESGGGGNVNFPLIGDNLRKLSQLFHIPQAINGKNEATTIIVSPEGKIVKRLVGISVKDTINTLFGEK